MTEALPPKEEIAEAGKLPLSERLRAFLHRYSFRAYYRQNKIRVILTFLVTAFALVAIGPFFIVRTPAGYIGAIFRPLMGGTDTSYVILEGAHIVLPFNTVTNYDTRLLVKEEKYQAITSEGLNVEIGITYRFRLHPSKVGLVHKTIGPDYNDKLIAPAIGMVVKAEVAKFSVHQVYGKSRKIMQARIFSGIIDPMNRNLIESIGDPDAPKGSAVVGRRIRMAIEKEKPSTYTPVIELVDVLISNVVLPQRVADAIEKKQEQEQLKEEYVFRLEREKMESQRKEIEADGIARFQQKVQAGISPNYLKWRGIEATLKLATSDNAKTVIIGGKDGLPLILNTDEASSGRATSGTKALKGVAKK